MDPPVPLLSSQGANVILSPDGGTVVFVSGEDQALYVKHSDRLEAARLSGTEGAKNPFFSPDGQWIGFFTDDALKKVPIDGGTLQKVCEVNERSRGGTWGEDGVIIFAARGGGALSSVPDKGGIPEVLTTLDEGDRRHTWPDLLPGGEAFLMTVGLDAVSSRIEAVSLLNGHREILHAEGSYARYVPTGHLVFQQETTLLAAPFDPDRLKLLGEPIPVLEGVQGAQFAFSQKGNLIYQTGSEQI